MRDTGSENASEWWLQESRLTPGDSGRRARLAYIVAHAEHVWRDAESARQFLVTPHPELADRPPIEVAAEELGARRVQAILDGILHGLPA